MVCAETAIRLARVYAPVAYLPSVVPKTWLAMPRGSSENSLQCFLPTPWSGVLVLKISTSLEWFAFFLNAKGNYHVYNRAPPTPVLSQMNPFHPLPWVFLLRPIFTVILYQRLGFPSNVFSVRFFPTKTSCAFSSLSRLLHALSISSSSIWSHQYLPRSANRDVSVMHIPRWCSNITLFSDFFSL